MIHFARWKVIIILMTCFLGIAYAVPNLLPRTTLSWINAHLPAIFPYKTVNLGLDLQGGSQLLLEVDVKAVIEERLISQMDLLKRELRQNRFGYSDMRLGLVDGDKVISFNIRSSDQNDQILKMVKKLDSDYEVSLIEPATVQLKLKAASMHQRKELIMAQSIEVVRRRVDETGTREPSIQRQGEDRIMVQLPGLDDPGLMKRLLGKTAKLSFRLVDFSATEAALQTGRVPQGYDLLPFQENPNQKLALERRIIITGDMLVDSQPGFHDGRPIVNFTLDNVGGKKFGEATAQNTGRLFAIVLDNEIISAPRIKVPILSGSGYIEGDFSVQAANDLALLLRSGALPAPLKIIEERSIGPGLGADSIEAGKISAMAGLLAVVVFMFVSYGFLGLLADIALLLNVVFIFACLSLFEATLTLPGIAGIILTIGMAVDANVLIFERIREELRLGAKVGHAIEAGYQHALSAIMDGNLTTLIASFLLIWFGSGPVKGFAITLSIGIITSLFSAVMVTRLMVVKWYWMKRPTSIRL